MNRKPPGERERINALSALALRALDARAALEEALELCGLERERCDALPIEADEERLAHWLLGALEGGADGALRFRVAESAWHGRVESFDLELEGAEESAGSAVLARLPRALADAPERAALAALAYASIAARRIVERVDPRLCFGARPALEVEVASSAGSVSLGTFTEAGWTGG